MNSKLTTGEKLKDLRVEKDLTLEELANEVHLSASTLSNYENDGSIDLSAVNILKLAEYYGVSTDYLLGKTENRTGNLTEIEELHLDDETIEILKNEKINNRLLCEMIKDPGFIKTMTDIEIYVEGMAQSLINNLNAAVNTTREELIKQCHPSETDIFMETLKAAEIDEGYYFAERIHRDLDEVIQRIRQLYKNDKTTKPQSSISQLIQQAFKLLEKTKGTMDEKLLFSFCYPLEINIKTLTEDEKQTFIGVLKKSKKLKAGMSNRGKNRNR